MPAPPGYPSYTKIVGSPVCGWIAIDTPPTSQRSQIANSGSRPMSACSAACTAPITLAGSTPASLSASSGTVYQHARVVSSRGGKSSGTVSMISFVDDLPSLVRHESIGHGRPRRGAPHRHPRPPARLRRRSRCRCLRGVGCARRGRRLVPTLRRGRRHRGRRLGTGDPGGDRWRRDVRPGRPAPSRPCRRDVRLLSTSWYSSDEPLRSPTPRRRGMAPDPVHPVVAHA